MSAYLGDPPISGDDQKIYKAIRASKGSTFFPNAQYPFDLPRPYPDAPNVYTDNGRRITAAASCLLVGIILINGGRFCIRFAKRVPFGLDDAFAIPAALIAVAFCAIVLYLNQQHGKACFGYHTYSCTYSQMNRSFEATYTAQLLFFPGVYCAKLSILFLNRRLTAFTRGWWIIAFWTVLALLVVFGLFSFLATLLSCFPVAAHFSLLRLGGTDPKSIHCLSHKVQNQIQNATRALHISSDLLLLSIPVLVLWKVQMARWDKIMVGSLFGFGVIAVLASIMRIVEYTNNFGDISVDYYPIEVWNTIDISFSSMVTSLPVWAGVIDHVLRSASVFVSKMSDSLASSSFGDRSRSHHAQITGGRGSGQGSGLRSKNPFSASAGTPRGTSHERLHDALGSRGLPNPLAMNPEAATRSIAQGGASETGGGKTPPEGQAIGRWDEIELSTYNTKQGHEMV